MRRARRMPRESFIKLSSSSSSSYHLQTSDCGVNSEPQGRCKSSAFIISDDILFYCAHCLMWFCDSPHAVYTEFNNIQPDRCMQYIADQPHMYYSFVTVIGRENSCPSSCRPPVNTSIPKIFIWSYRCSFFACFNSFTKKLFTSSLWSCCIFTRDSRNCYSAS